MPYPIPITGHECPQARTHILVDFGCLADVNDDDWDDNGFARISRKEAERLVDYGWPYEKCGQTLYISPPTM